MPLPKPSRHPFRRLLSVTAVALSWCAATAAAPLPLEVTTAEYHQVTLEQVFDGAVEAVHRTTVSAETAGRVVEMHFDVDDYVPKDAVLLRLTDADARAALQQARAALEEAEARHEQAASAFARVRALFAKGTASAQARDSARADLNAAKAQLDRARAGVAQAEESLAQTVVRAPYSGVVVERHIEVGEMAAPGTPLMTGFSLERLRAVTVVPQSLMDAVRRHARARILAQVASETRELAGDKLTFAPYADPYSHAFRVRVALPPGEHGIYPGTFVKIAFVIGEERRLMVPSRAVAHRSEVRAVYVQKTDGRLSFRQVRLGRVHGERVEVLAGLKAGERVALDPVRAAVMLKETRASPSP